MKQQERAKELAAAHWGYIEKVLTTHAVTRREIENIGFHYRTAMEHGFKHGVEWERERAEEEAFFEDVTDHVVLEAELDRSCGNAAADAEHATRTKDLFARGCPTCLDAATCAKAMATDTRGKCLFHRPSLRENMLDAKQEAAHPTCATCERKFCSIKGDPGTEDGLCVAYEAKQEAPTAAVLPTTHTDPSTNCKDCHNAACVGKGRNLTCDQGCERFIPKELTKPYQPLDFTLPTYAVACNRREILEKFKEEVEEYEDATEGSMAQMIEAWDCVQVAQTYREHGGCSHDVEVGAIMVNLHGWHETGLPVMQAKRAMMIKNAARAMYSDKDNAAILATV